MYRIAEPVDATAGLTPTVVEPAAVLAAGGGRGLPDFGNAAPRIVACVPLDEVAARLAAQVRLDVLWLRGEVAISSEMGEAIRAECERLGAGLVCEMAGPALDAAFGEFAHLPAVQFLTAPDPVERALALAAAQKGRFPHVADGTRDAAQERIDRLQDEVARISALLEALADRPYGYLARSDDFSSHRPANGPVSFSPAMRDTARHYRAEADLAPYVRAQPDEGPSAPVRRILRQRRMREQFFPADLFADPAWDMLLDLYAAQLDGQPVAVSSLCIAAAVPATTALRWIKTMTDTGLFERHADPRDGRRIFIGLSDKAAQAMERYFAALEGMR